MRKKVLALSSLICIVAGTFGGGTLTSQIPEMSCSQMSGSDCFDEGAKATCSSNDGPQGMTCWNGYWVVGGPRSTIETNP